MSTGFTDIDYIPGSVEEDISLGSGERLEATPEDWSTTEERAQLHTLNKKTESDDSGGTGLPIIPIVIGVCVVAVAAVVITVILKKGASTKAGK